MKFESPSFTDLYSKLKDNNRLKKYLIKLGALLIPEDFYSEYGFKNTAIDKRFYIEDANNEIYRNLTTLLLANENTLKSKTITALVNEGFLKEEIKDALGFESDIILPRKAYREIFYTYKYCYTESFFQNNWENFMPLIDFEKMDENEAGSAFMDALMKEFDKIDYIISHSKDWVSIRDIPYDYINYLTQLLGIEIKTFYMKDELEGKYRELAANILDVYKGKGSIGTFKLLFNFLGFNLDIRFYYFDRRRYWMTSGESTEFTTSDYTTYPYYLTTNNPADNLLEGISTNETVTLKDFGENQNIFNFNELVEKYGIRCVLGYDNVYEENGKQKTYNQPVYTYFRTNYIRVRPSKKYEEGNFSTTQLYQLGALLDFLTPEFLQREIYVKVDIGGSGEEPLIINWNRYYNEVFCMLDSEEFNQNFTQNYIYNYNDYKNTGYITPPTVLDDNGKEKRYLNSLGLDSHFGIDENDIPTDNYFNIFFNPLSEKIKIINSTEFWGINKTDNISGAVYPVWRSDRNYKVVDENGNKTTYKIKVANNRDTIYFPRDYTLFRNSGDATIWRNTPVVNLNGYMNYTIRKKLAENSNSSLPLKEEIKYITNLPIELFVADPDIQNYNDGLKTINPYEQILINFLNDDPINNPISEIDKKLNEYKSEYKSGENVLNNFKEYISNIKASDAAKYNYKSFNNKSWKEIENFSYYCCATYTKAKDLIEFIKNCKGYIINFDYNNNKLFGRFFINLLNFGSKNVNDKTYNYMYINSEGNTAAEEAISKYNDYRISSLINSLTTENCYLIGYQTSNNLTTYYVYKYMFAKKLSNLAINRERFVPTLSYELNNYAVDNYTDIINNLTYENDRILLYNNTLLKTINLTENNRYVIKVKNDNTNYVLSTVPLENKVIIHKANVLNPAYASLKAKNNTKDTSADIIGNFYFKNAYDNDKQSVKNDYDETKYENEYLFLNDIRIPKFYQYRYSNIKKNDLIYSKYNGKLYKCLGDGVYVADSAILASETETSTEVFDQNGTFVKDDVVYKFSEDLLDISKNSIFGLKEIQYYGEVREENNKYYLYRYDEIYQGFNENDDDDNYIFNNYNRNITWKNLNINFYDYLKRPIRERVDKYYNELNLEVKNNGAEVREKNKLAFDILKEICEKSQNIITKKQLF